MEVRNGNEGYRRCRYRLMPCPLLVVLAPWAIFVMLGISNRKCCFDWRKSLKLALAYFSFQKHNISFYFFKNYQLFHDVFVWKCAVRKFNTEKSLFLPSFAKIFHEFQFFRKKSMALYRTAGRLKRKRLFSLHSRRRNAYHFPEKKRERGLGLVFVNNPSKAAESTCKYKESSLVH